MIKSKLQKRMQSMTLIVWNKVCVYMHIYVDMNLEFLHPHSPQFSTMPPAQEAVCLDTSMSCLAVWLLVRLSQWEPWQDVSSTRVVHSPGPCPTFTTSWLYLSKGHSVCPGTSPSSFLPKFQKPFPFFASVDPEIIKINTSPWALHNSL